MKKAVDKLIGSVNEDIQVEVSGLAHDVLLKLQAAKFDEVNTSLKKLGEKIGDADDGKVAFKEFKGKINKQVKEVKKVQNTQDKKTAVEAKKAEKIQNVKEKAVEEVEEVPEESEEEGATEENGITQQPIETSSVGGEGISGNMVPPGSKTVVSDIGNILNNTLGGNGLFGVLKHTFDDAVVIGKSVWNSAGGIAKKAGDDIGGIFSSLITGFADKFKF